MILSLVAHPLTQTMLDSLLGNWQLMNHTRKWVSLIFGWISIVDPQRKTITFFSSDLTMKHLTVLKSKSILKVQKNGTTDMYLKGQFSLFFFNLLIIIKLTCWLLKAPKDNHYVLLKCNQKSILKIFKSGKTVFLKLNLVFQENFFKWRQQIYGYYKYF